MLKVCYELEAEIIVLPELSEIYYGFDLVLCAEVFLNECRFFIDERRFNNKKVPFKSFVSISKS